MNYDSLDREFRAAEEAAEEADRAAEELHHTCADCGRYHAVTILTGHTNGGDEWRACPECLAAELARRGVRPDGTLACHRCGGACPPSPFLLTEGAYCDPCALIVTGAAS